VKTENNTSNSKPSTPVVAQAESAVVKRRGGRRGGGGGGGGEAGEQRDSINGADATWTCHCGLWTCLCAPSLIREATGDASNSHNSSNNNSHSNSNNSNTSSKDDAGEDESVPPSSRPSAKASPVRDAEAPDTPTLAASQTGGKKGGKKTTTTAGRGRSNPAPTPSERDRDDKDSPRNNPTNQDGDSTPVPALAINGTVSKRGKRGQAHLKDSTNDSGESDRDHNHLNGAPTTAAHSDAEPPHTSDTHAHPHTGKKKEPSMNELKRRAAAMLDWIERAQVDLGRSSLVHAGLSMSPSSGSASPPDVTAGGGPVGGGGELGSVAMGLHEQLLGWQVEYGAS
jgi:hypothetical protein